MAEEEKDAAAAPEPEPKKKSPIILVAVLVLVGLALAGGISYFVTSKLVTDSAANVESGYHDPGVFIKLGDAKEGQIVVNVGGIKSGRFLKIGLVVEFNPGKKSNLADGVLLPPAQTKVDDVTLNTLRSLKLEELDASKQDELKAKLKDNLNEALGPGSVYDIYITSFVLQ
jgi:flagellar FliL protein